MLRNTLAAVLCLALVVWSLVPSASHVPSVFDVMAEHSQIITEHGHAHGLEEDLFWALHGHSHDVADHDHSQAMLTVTAATHLPTAWREPAPLPRPFNGPHRIYLLERPPRA